MPNIEAKQVIVQEIADKLKNAQGTVVVDYRGLNVEEVTDLRKQARDQGVDYKVYKNSMMRFAAKEAGLEGLLESLVGPTGIAFCESDPVAAAKLFSNFAKDHKALEIKAGVVEGRVLDVAGVDELAKLPPREQLVAKVLGGLNAPIAGFANVLNANLKGLVVALNAIAEQKAEA
ncbi:MULTISPECIES: 50S ribosomal protein L10 [Eubacterium]|uniref:Large ribosomal subunit protein uL10 n=2 Tax=Eubacterium TaxID=1730 RepID=A0A1H4EDV4_9FIRM|nr:MULTISPECIES: 50S ribosomal protein L10 [Eubacterium]MDD4692335.1 50S ribosomal protein L10 [Eubacterium aggregans]MEA5073836.1 50S ribosomal protein L10 [Eubacterium aggregans]SDX63708.1 LSU ribosomal protein L10P [Eubacterium barkeri]SEA82979.1 LSU ribosomal protein L10P [Eubacterium aggregans]